MSIQTLRDRLPEYAKDLKLSLGTLAGETVLDDTKKAGTFVAAAIASRNNAVIEAVIAEFGPRLDPAAFNAAKAAAAIMAMNNVYYRFLHLVEDEEYAKLRAGLRMNVIGNPGHRARQLRAVVARGVGGERLRQVHHRAREGVA